MDPEGRIAVRQVVADLRGRGVCVLLTTHELSEAEKAADRIVILSAGRVVLEGTPQALTTGAGGAAGPAVVTFGAPPGLDTGALAEAVGPRARVSETAPGRYRVEAGPGAAPPAVTAAVATFLAGRGAAITDLVAGKTLEDVYFEAVGAAAAEANAETEAAGTAGTSAGRGRRGRAR